MKCLAIATVWALVLGWTAAQISAADKVLFVLDWVQYGSHVGYYNALEGGFFKRAGMDVTIQRGYGSGDTIKRIGSRKGDFGFADAGTLVVARSRGTKVKSIGVLYNLAPHTAFALKSSGIRTVKDLSGRRYGDDAGGSTFILFPALAALHGVKDTKFTNLAPAAKDPALLAKKVDFTCTYLDRLPSLQAAAATINDEIVALQWAANGLDFHGNGIIVHDDTIRDKPDLVGRFVNAVFKGVAEAIRNRDLAVQRFVKNFPVADPSMINKQWGVLISLAYSDETKKIGLGGLSAKKMNGTIDLITKYMKLPSRARVTDIYAPQFLKKILP